MLNQVWYHLVYLKIKLRDELIFTNSVRMKNFDSILKFAIFYYFCSERTIIQSIQIITFDILVIVKTINIKTGFNFIFQTMKLPQHFIKSKINFTRTKSKLVDLIILLITIFL